MSTVPGDQDSDSDPLFSETVAGHFLGGKFLGISGFLFDSRLPVLQAPRFRGLFVALKVSKDA
jgi:hypothetical protein